MKAILLFFLLCASALAATYTTDGTREDVTAKIAAASPGDIVEIPEGTFIWETPLAFNKGIHLRGAGSGGIRARDPWTNLLAATGSKTFYTEEEWAEDITVGRGITAHALHNGEGLKMMGTVTSYNGHDLVINVTSVVTTDPAAGSAWGWGWVFRTTAQTTIVNGMNSGIDSFLVIVNSATDPEVSGIYWAPTWGTPGSHFEIQHNAGFPRIHDCQFVTYNAHALAMRTNKGIIYKCNFDNGLYAGDGINGAGSGNFWGSLVFHPEGYAPDSWNTPSTMGAADTTGTNNFYVEDCRVTGSYTQFSDFGGNSRAVLRNNIIDNSAIGSHGQDTSPSGMRHFEIYDNTFYYNVMGIEGFWTYPLSSFIHIRGGTGVITGNAIPDATGQAYGNINELWLSCFNIQTSVSVNLSCQTTYPASRQIGRGYVDGSGPSMPEPVGVGNANVANAFKGDLEPLYSWANTGAHNTTFLRANNTDTCGNGLDIVNFVTPDQDYYMGTSKPGWTRYTYPHPLRSGESPDAGSVTISGAGSTTVNGAGSVTFSSP